MVKDAHTNFKSGTATELYKWFEVANKRGEQTATGEEKKKEEMEKERAKAEKLASLEVLINAAALIK